LTLIQPLVESLAVARGDHLGVTLVNVVPVLEVGVAMNVDWAGDNHSDIGRNPGGWVGGGCCGDIAEV